MKEILETILSSKYEAFIVGGYVRDYLLNITSFDVDIATNADVDTIEKLFKHKGKKYKDYLSYHLKDDIYNYDITTYRREIEYKNNKPIRVERIYDLYSDLLRRDFTINTLAMNYKGEIIDLLGGKKDLDNKLIKVVGDTYERLEEDNTRILRAIRFSVTLGFELDFEIKNFLREKSFLLKSLKKEYIKSELDKIFNNDNKIIFFDIVKEYKLDSLLHIKYDKIINTSYYGTWALIETDLPFDNESVEIIDIMKSLIKKGSIDKLDIYTYGEDICHEVVNILGVKDNVNEMSDSLTIRNFMDIDIDIETIKKVVNNSNINKVFKLIETEIVLGKLNNNREEIIKYIGEVKL